MYIYTVRCLYVEFRCICVRFDNFVRNGTPYPAPKATIKIEMRSNSLILKKQIMKNDDEVDVRFRI